MKYLNKKDRELAEENYEYAALLKEVIMTEDANEIRLWDATDGAIVGHYLADDTERGYIIEVIMSGCGEYVPLPGKNLVKACAAFNTILQTIKA